MKLLITGGTGFLGRRAAAHFKGLGFRVLTPSHGELDITDREAVLAWFRENRPEAVIHTAAVSDTLVPRVTMALEQTGYKKIAVAGGVAANSRIRGDLMKECEKRGVRLCLPPLSLCGDNAAMTAAEGYYMYKQGITADLSLNAFASDEAAEEYMNERKGKN